MQQPRLLRVEAKVKSLKPVKPLSQSHSEAQNLRLKRPLRHQHAAESRQGCALGFAAPNLDFWKLVHSAAQKAAVYDLQP